MNVSELRALCQRAILHSRGGNKGKLFCVLPVKSYRSAVTALIIVKLGARLAVTGRTEVPSASIRRSTTVPIK